MSQPAGFDEFVAANSRSLLRAAWLLTGDWPAAEDLVQNTLAACWPRWASITTPEAYVRRTLTTTYLRGRRRRWTGEIATAELPDVAHDDDAPDRLAAQHVLRSALAALTARQRLAVVLRYFADQSEADTAAAMGCSVGAVKSHTARAIARLRAIPAVAELLS